MIYCNISVVLPFVIKLYHSRPMEISGIEDCPGMGSVLPEENAEDDEEEEETDLGGGSSVLLVLNADEIPEQLTENTTALVYLNQLRVLANMKVTKCCQVIGCGEDLGISVHHVGSAVYLKWVILL